MEYSVSFPSIQLTQFFKQDFNEIKIDKRNLLNYYNGISLITKHNKET